MSDKELVIVPRSVDELVSLSDRLAKATTLNAELRDKPANVMAAIMAGAELGLAPMASLRAVHLIKGIPKLSADAMVAAVLASGKALYFEPRESTSTSATWITKRVGSTHEQSCTWTTEDAKRAGLVNDNHRLYPRQMLSSRAKSELARNIYSDVLLGVYTEDEIPDVSGSASSGSSAIDAEIVTDTTDGPDALIAKIKLTESLDGLLEIAKAANKLKGAERKAVHEAYVLRKRELETPAAAPVAETAA